MNHPYFDAILLVERLHRHFLEVVKVDLDAKGVKDINNVQALILYNIGRDEMTIGELTARGYYLGKNVSYNVKGLVDAEYLIQERSPHDRRSFRVKLSAKGLELHAHLNAFFEKQIQHLDSAGLKQDDVMTLIGSLRKLEKFWTSIINYNRGV